MVAAASSRVRHGFGSNYGNWLPDRHRRAWMVESGSDDEECMDDMMYAIVYKTTKGKNPFLLQIYVSLLLPLSTPRRHLSKQETSLCCSFMHRQLQRTGKKERKESEGWQTKSNFVRNFLCVLSRWGPKVFLRDSASKSYVKKSTITFVWLTMVSNP